MAKRAEGTGTDGLVLTGQSKPKKRKPRRYEWTKAKEKIFLTTLAETCNVTAAAEAAGMSAAGAYFRRKKVAAFRAAWAEAIATAYQRLELELLERALNGTEKIVRRRDGSEERIRDYSNSVALTLLKMHRDSASEAQSEAQEVDVEDVRKRLVEKLERLRTRFESDAQ